MKTTKAKLINFVLFNNLFNCISCVLQGFALPQLEWQRGEDRVNTISHLFRSRPVLNGCKRCVKSRLCLKSHNRKILLLSLKRELTGPLLVIDTRYSPMFGG